MVVCAHVTSGDRCESATTHTERSTRSHCTARPSVRRGQGGHACCHRQPHPPDPEVANRTLATPILGHSCSALATTGRSRTNCGVDAVGECQGANSTRCCSASPSVSRRRGRNMELEASYTLKRAIASTTRWTSHHWSMQHSMRRGHFMILYCTSNHSMHVVVR